MYNPSLLDTAHTTQQAVTRLVDFFEHLTPASVQHMGDVYAPNVYFKDPFNEVYTLAAMQSIFNHMYQKVNLPCFEITEQLIDGQQCFLTWNFHFYFKQYKPAQKQTLRGSSHIKFTNEGLVDFHRDYWDAAEELYEKLPVLGSVLRWIKSRT